MVALPCANLKKKNGFIHPTTENTNGGNIVHVSLFTNIEVRKRKRKERNRQDNLFKLSFNF